MLKQLKYNGHVYPSIQNMFNLPHNSPLIIAGPCSIENEDQLECVARSLVKNQVRFIRGGAYKPRSSPYDFQGMGLQGLKLIRSIADRHALYVVSEILDPRDVEYGIRYTDIIQIGSRNMQNYALLKEVGKSNHPILLKRGMMSTIQEFVYAAEYIANEGNYNIILCERGIRTFETFTRNNLDITCIAVIKNQTSFSIIADISHAAGRTDIIPILTQYLFAMNIDGVMLEIHPTPLSSFSDAQQTLSISEFERLLQSLKTTQIL